jgi:cell division protein ZapA
MQDYIAMVLIWYATEQLQQAADGIQKDNLAEKLGLLEKLLDSQLENDK